MIKMNRDQNLGFFLTPNSTLSINEGIYSYFELKIGFQKTYLFN